MQFNNDSTIASFARLYKEVLGIRFTENHALNLEFLLSSIENDDRWQDIRQISYFLATIMHETAHTFAPIKEIMAKPGTRVAQLQAKYKGWEGKGYIQLTHKTNYERMSNLLGVDLVANPSLALNPAISYEIAATGCILGSFTGKKLSDYINESKCDFINARRVVNGTDRADLIAGYAQRINKILLETVEKISATACVEPEPVFIDPSIFNNEPQEIKNTTISTPEQQPIKIEPHTSPEITKDLKYWLKWILGGLGISTAGTSTWFSGLTINWHYVILITCTLMVVCGFGTAIYYYVKVQREKMKHELTLKEMDIRANPNLYNVEVEKRR